MKQRGAGHYRAAGRQALSNHWSKAMIISLACLVVGVYSVGPLPTLLVGLEELGALAAAGTVPALRQVFAADVSTLRALLFFLLGAAPLLGCRLWYLRLSRGAMQGNGLRDHLSTLIERLPQLYKAIGLRLILWAGRVIGTLLLVVPGLVVHYRYSQATWLMADDPQMSIRQALAKSRQLMRGHQRRLLLLDLSFIGWLALCAATAFLGLVLLVPYHGAARAAFYRELVGEVLPEPHEAEPRAPFRLFKTSI